MKDELMFETDQGVSWGNELTKKLKSSLGQLNTGSWDLFLF
jgi:hypothetical protein